MSDEGFRIRNENAALALAATMDADATSPDTFLSYRTSRFCVDRRLRRDRNVDRPRTAFALPPAALPTPSRADHPVKARHSGTLLRSNHPSRAPASMFDRLQAEDDEGDVEYKWCLTGVTPQRFEHLVTQMQFRVREGHGQCLYEIGVRDDGRMEGLPKDAFDESVQTIHRMAEALDFECQEVRRVLVASDEQNGSAPDAATAHYCAELLVSRRHAEVGAPETTVAFCGTTGSGKSTLMGVLFSESLDDGNGTLSQLLFNHKHEVDSGRTSSMSTRVWSVSCGLSMSSRSSAEDAGSPNVAAEPTLTVPAGNVSQDSEDGGSSRFSQRASSLISLSEFSNTTADTSVARAESHTGTTTTTDTPPPTGAQPPATPSQRFISLLDLGGDISKTTLFGLMSRDPDLVCICVQAGCTNASSAVLCAKACRAMNKMLAIVVTQVDLLEDFELDSFLMDLSSELEAALLAPCYVVEGADPMLFTPTAHSADAADKADVLFTAPTFQAPRVPIFCVSSVSGAGLDVFRACVARVPARRRRLHHHGDASASTAGNSRTSFEVRLDRRSFFVEGTGPIVSGVVSSGPVAVGTHCFIGPDNEAQFHRVQLRGIHVNGVHVNEARQGDEATFALSDIPAAVELAAKGKVLTSVPLPTVKTKIQLCVAVLAQELKGGAQPVLYTRNARQAVRVLSVSDCARGGDHVPEMQATRTVAVECEFLYRAEILEIKTPVLLHWAPHGLAVGRVVSF